MFGDLARARLLTGTAAFIGLIALGSWISIPFFPVPLTLQTLFVLLAAAVLFRYAVVTVSLYLLLGALGLPLFHNGIAGIGVLLGPTGGYLIGFLPAALIAGLAFERKSPAIRIFGIAAATLAIYACGIAWLMVSSGLSFIPAVTLGMLPFIPGDGIKAFAAWRIAERLQ